MLEYLYGAWNQVPGESWVSIYRSHNRCSWDMIHDKIAALNYGNGYVNASIIRVAKMLRRAIRENCPSIIVVHNHPSDDSSPGAEDILVTRKIVSCGQMLDIKLLDHIIIGGQSHVSMKEKGLGFGDQEAR